ncbi:hypothetical protein [Allonocardiopsis opalescens]|uniref:hypothetical protein n=1 Tax=Allonocardiopsis opalescens TaxID=1144618 RepID=UPI0011B1EA89|nr:hypothetical protein [Allonocardiopsis opalescens]
MSELFSGSRGAVRTAIEQLGQAESYYAEETVSGGRSSGVSEIRFTTSPLDTHEILQADANGREFVFLMRGTTLITESREYTGLWYIVDEMPGKPVYPVAELELMLGAEEIVEVGPESLGGATTTRYTGSYLPQAGLAEISEEHQAEAYESFLDGVDQVSFDLWVDESGYPRRIEQDFGEVSAELEFSEFDESEELFFPRSVEIVEYLMLDPYGDMMLAEQRCRYGGEDPEDGSGGGADASGEPSPEASESAEPSEGEGSGEPSGSPSPSASGEPWTDESGDPVPLHEPVCLRETGEIDQYVEPEDGEEEAAEGEGEGEEGQGEGDGEGEASGG